MAIQELIEDQENADVLLTLSTALFPLWSKHIEAAKTLTSQSIEELSAKFAALSQQIQHVTNHDSQHNTERLISLLNESQQDLSDVINLLKKSFEDKEALVQAISELGVNAKSLGNMADVVTRIAKETGMVAVNAAIEAARVGDRGRGFAVVAEAVRRLSDDAARTGNHISDTVTEVTKAVQKVQVFSAEFTKKDAQTMADAERVVNTVLHQFGDMANQVVSASKDMVNESRAVGKEIDQVLVSLQFQDRVSQMLTHVCNDINKLNHTVINGEAIGDSKQWLDAFKSTYVMREQYQIHANRYKSTPAKSLSKSKPAQQDEGEITFF